MSQAGMLLLYLYGLLVGMWVLVMLSEPITNRLHRSYDRKNREEIPKPKVKPDTLHALYLEKERVDLEIAKMIEEQTLTSLPN